MSDFHQLIFVIGKPASEMGEQISCALVVLAASNIYYILS